MSERVQRRVTDVDGVEWTLKESGAIVSAPRTKTPRVDIVIIAVEGPGGFLGHVWAHPNDLRDYSDDDLREAVAVARERGGR
jgi:hypothetical protein